MPVPAGWATAANGDELLAELRRELSPGHALAGVALEICGRRVDRDDVLFRDVNAADRFVIVHLTWRGRAEPDARWPAVVFDGTWEELVAEEAAAR